MTEVLESRIQEMTQKFSREVMAEIGAALSDMFRKSFGAPDSGGATRPLTSQRLRFLRSAGRLAEAIERREPTSGGLIDGAHRRAAARAAAKNGDSLVVGLRRPMARLTVARRALAVSARALPAAKPLDVVAKLPTVVVGGIVGASKTKPAVPKTVPKGMILRSDGQMRRKGPIQLCPVPKCQNRAAPVYGMVCQKHKDTPKKLVQEYRKARHDKNSK